MHWIVAHLLVGLQIFFNEFLGTATLVFIGCMGCIAEADDEAQRLGLALCFGMAVFVGVQVSCHNSGGHVNPAVTLLSLFFKKIKWYMAPVYIFAQFFGGVIGFSLLKGITPPHFVHNYSEGTGVCTTIPHVSLGRAFFAEFFFTSILLLVVCSGWDERNTHLDSFSLKVGFAVFALVYIGGSYTGCSMNPARSFGPAVLNGVWTHHWIYWLAPLLATGVVGLIYTQVFRPISTEKKVKETEEEV